MEFLVKVDGETNLRSLRSWLIDDPSVRHARLVSAPPAPGEQGALFDTIQAVVSDGISVGSLIFTIKQWQATRRDPPPAKVVDPDGGEHAVKPDGSSNGQES